MPYSRRLFFRKLMPDLAAGAVGVEVFSMVQRFF
jgi:hypothetical protein